MSTSSAIANVLTAVRSGYGAYRECGSELYDRYGFFWLIQEKGSVYAKSQEGKLVKGLKKELYDGLKAIAQDTGRNINPSKTWNDICGYGMDAAGIERPTKETTSTGREPKVRNIEELLALYKFNLNLETGEMDDANIHIGRALAVLGVDLSEVA